MKTEQSIRFTKMHALGNDFVVINALAQPSILSQQLSISYLANRHMGIGFDQLLVLGPSERADFFVRIYNADGNEAEQCGNGLRCVARFIHEEKLHRSLSFCLETKAGIYPVTIKNYDHISVIMGPPQVQEALIEMPLTRETITLSILSVGNPHAILKVLSVDNILTEQLGPEITANNAYFPQGTNVGFMQIMTPHHIRLRTFERGVGETLACGSNACAAVAAGIANGWLQQQVQVEFRYGSLFINWEGSNKPIQMIGPAYRVFTGEIN